MLKSILDNLTESGAVLSPFLLKNQYPITMKIQKGSNICIHIYFDNVLKQARATTERTSHPQRLM